MNLLIGITGSSGVMDLPLYFRIFQEKLEANIKLVTTPSVSRFVSPQFLKKFIPGGKHYEDLHVEDDEIQVPHSDLSKWADVYLILPCTANTLAKAAHGITDNLLLMLVLCFPKPTLFFPNMNPHMWEKPVTQMNVRLLLEQGHRVIQPTGNGWITATGESMDSGHMPPPHACAEYILNFQNQSKVEHERR